MESFDGIVIEVRNKFPDCPPALALNYAQKIYKRILTKAEFRTADRTVSSVVAGQREYALNESDVRIYGCTYFTDQNTWNALTPTSEDALRDRDPAWKDRLSLADAINITLATAATPVVITTESAHGLVSANDGTLTNQAYIAGVGGLADGYYFVKVTGYSTTTCALYTDLALTTGAAGDGTLSSSGSTFQLLGPESGTPCEFYVAGAADSASGKTGKLVIGFDIAPDTTTVNGYPYFVCHCEQHVVVDGSTVIPYSMLDELAIVFGACWLYCLDEHQDRAGFWEVQYLRDEIKQIGYLRKLLPATNTLMLPPKGPMGTRLA